MRRHHAAIVTLACAALGAARASAEDLVVLDSGGGLVYVQGDTAITSIGRPVTGTGPDGRIVAIAVRQRTGVLYGMTPRRLFSLDLETGEATPVGPRFPDVGMSAFREFGFAFDPAHDVARLVRAGYEFTRTFSQELDPDSGALVWSSPQLVYAAGDPAEGAFPYVTSLALADGDGPAPWTMFGIDQARRSLVRLGSVGGVPGRGEDADVATTIAPLVGLPERSQVRGLELGEFGGYVLADVQGAGWGTNVYSLDLATGLATEFADLGGRNAVDIAAVPTTTLPGAQPLVVTGGSVRLDFHRRRKADFVEVTGVIPLPPASWEGVRIRVDLADDVREFVLDARGRGSSGASTFRFTTLSAGPEGFPFTLRLRKGRFLRNVFNADSEGRRDVLFDVYLDRAVRRAAVQIDYEARRKRGVGRLRAN